MRRVVWKLSLFEEKEEEEEESTYKVSHGGRRRRKKPSNYCIQIGKVDSKPEMFPYSQSPNLFKSAVWK